MSVDATTRSSGKLYYGWVIVLAAFFAFGLVYGTVLYSYTVFVNPIAKAFDTTPTKVLFGFTLTNIGTGVLGVYGGRLLARSSLRYGMIAGAVILALGFFLLSMITALWQLYVLYGIVVAFGAIVVAPLGASALVANWFTASRGRALTLATLGTSFGQLLIPRLGATLIEDYGWQTAYRAFAVLIVAIAVPVLFFVVVSDPADKGLSSFGGDAGDAAIEAAAPPLLSTGEILRRREFWTIGISYALTVTVYLALVATIVPYARTYGATAIQASSLTVCMGVAAIVGKLAFATWTDRMGLRNTFWIAVALNLVAVAMLVLVPGYNILFLASACVGASAGGVLPLWPGLIAFRFGRHALAQVMGLMSPMVLIVQGLGAPFATWMNFRPAFIVFGGMLILSAVCSRNLERKSD